MRRFGLATAAAFCVAAGFIFGEFARTVRPVDYLIRPLLIAVGLAIVLGLVSSLTGHWAVVAAVFSAAWVVQPWSTVALGVAVVVALLVAYRLWRHQAPTVDGPLVLAVGVFAIAGLIPIVPLMSWSTPARASTTVEGPPQYAILLDGYPRADTLASYGLDVSPFLDALEERGFTVYEKATSTHHATFDTLTELLGGSEIGDSIPAQRRIRETWALPDGWDYIAPPVGHVVIPGARLNPGGFSFLQAQLMARTLPGPWLGDLMMNGYRGELNRSLDLLATTDSRRVFAHLFAPHPPILYAADGAPMPAPECYPRCPFEPGLGEAGGYITWLNGRIVETVDAILERRPDAEIVLFSDHGGRYDPEDTDEWHRVLLTSRSPQRPELFDGRAHPGRVLHLLDQAG